MKIIKKQSYPSKGVYIRNINYNATIEDIDIFLTRYITNYDNMLMLKDRAENFIGRIVLIFDNEKQAMDAKMKLHNVKFLQRKLKVNYAYPKYIPKNSDLSDMFYNILKL